MVLVTRYIWSETGQIVGDSHPIYKNVDEVRKDCNELFEDWKDGFILKAEVDLTKVMNGEFTGDYDITTDGILRELEWTTVREFIA